MNISAKKKLLLGGVLVGTLSSMGLSTVGAAPNSKFCVNTASGNVRVASSCDSNELQLKGAKGATGATGPSGGLQGATGAAGNGTNLNIIGDFINTTIPNPVGIIDTTVSITLPVSNRIWSVAWSIQENTAIANSNFYLGFDDTTNITYPYVFNNTQNFYLNSSIGSGITCGTGNDTLDLSGNANTVFTINLYQGADIVTPNVTGYYSITLTLLP